MCLPLLQGLEELEGGEPIIFVVFVWKCETVVNVFGLPRS